MNQDKNHNPVIITAICAATVVIIALVVAFASGGIHFGSPAAAKPVAAAQPHKHHAAAQIPAAQAPAAPAPAVQAPAQSALRYAGTGTYGEAVYANGNTSDPFALTVEADYWANGGGSWYSHSTVTGQDYLMTSAANGNLITVTGGNSAEVQFRP